MAQSPVALNASSSSGLPVAFVSTSATVCTVNGTSVTLLAAGTCSVRADQAGNGAFNAAPSVTRSFTVNRVNQSITFESIGNKTLAQSPVVVAPTASSGLQVTLSSTTLSVCTVAGFSIVLIAPGTCTIRADQAGDATYNTASGVSRSFTVKKANQTISFPAIGAKTMLQSPVAVTASASSGLTVSLVSTTPVTCAVAATSITLLSAGNCTIRADQAGDNVYSAANSVSRSFTITRAQQTITFGPLANRTLAQSPFSVTATASSGLPVTFTTTTPTICTASGANGSTITLLKKGTCAVRAQQPGDVTYASAPNVNQSFAVKP
jgi:hypothetical protein